MNFKLNLKLYSFNTVLLNENYTLLNKFYGKHCPIIKCLPKYRNSKVYLVVNHLKYTQIH